MSEFEKLFNEVSAGKNRQEIYREWLEYVIDINMLLHIYIKSFLERVQLLLMIGMK